MNQVNSQLLIKCFVLLFLLVYCFACTEPKPSTIPILVELPNASISGGMPNLFLSNNQDVYLSWIEHLDDSTNALLFSKLENDHWTTAKTITSGSDWFVNWADFPSLVSYEDGKTLAAHWLQKSASGTYDYDIHISQSSDQGKHWSKDFIVHRDSIAAEHGFVTMIPAPQNRIFASWLDGRKTKSKPNNPKGHGHEHDGAMTLRTAEFDAKGNLYEELELDAKICDCCQTDAAMTSNGPIVVYRDRSEEEIRDISMVRKIGRDWTQPRNISNDQWKISGCPVNGPAIAALEHQLAVAWFTSANNQPSVKVIFSKDDGNTFSEPLIVEKIDPLGRVDIVLEKEKAYLSWLSKNNGTAVIKLAIINAVSSELISQHTLIKTSEERASGFPVLEKVNDQLILAWTEVLNEQTSVKTGFVKMD